MAGLTTHLETSGCPDAPSLNRDTIFAIVRQRDPRGLISKDTTSLRDWQSSDQAQRWKASDSAYNGSGWACGFAGCGRVCRKRKDLDRHLNSPAHYTPVYHCPNNNISRRRGYSGAIGGGGNYCSSSADFKTLASVISHLESETCGFMPFGKVQKCMRGVVTGKMKVLRLEPS